MKQFDFVEEARLEESMRATVLDIVFDMTKNTRFGMEKDKDNNFKNDLYIRNFTDAYVKSIELDDVSDNYKFSMKSDIISENTRVDGMTADDIINKKVDIARVIVRSMGTKIRDSAPNLTR
ncbi:hypothetical protein [Moritella dasanensis]|uniref:hypothetical protein n=1 Tax=Moritella dasanensis TaxID=428031 RepID=UPI00037407CB|nr:hypothetical protein [Moritella dasanensis]